MYECAGANKEAWFLEVRNCTRKRIGVYSRGSLRARPLHGLAEALMRYRKNLLFEHRVRGVVSLPLHRYRTIGLTFACGRSAL